MTTLLFKKSILDRKTIKVKVLRWQSCKEGIYAKTLEGWKLFSTSELYFWGTK